MDVTHPKILRIDDAAAFVVVFYSWFVYLFSLNFLDLVSESEKLLFEYIVMRFLNWVALSRK